MVAFNSSDLAKKPDGNVVFLVEKDEDLAKKLMTGLNQQGFKTRHFLELKDLQPACEMQLPMAVIIDIDFNRDTEIKWKILAEFSREAAGGPAMIFISEDRSMESRLAAVRMGASRYFQKPLDIEEIIHSLQSIEQQITIKPFRILLVGDDTGLLADYAKILRGAGMVVETLSRAMECLDVMAEFKPDTLILDAALSECSGTELMQVIRQNNVWAMLPIILLLSESDPRHQSICPTSDWEGFLLKPVAEDHLISAVNVRAKRARWAKEINGELEAALRENKFQLTALNQHDIVSIADMSGKITAVNDKFCQISGYDRDELLGQNHRILKSERHSKEFFEGLWQTISSGKVWHGSICNRNKEGHEYWVEATIVPFLDKHAKPYKYVSVRTDITSLMQSEERLNRSQVFARMGNWDWNIVTNEIFWSDRVWDILGLKKENDKGDDNRFLASIHPEDYHMMTDAINDCLKLGSELNVEHRVLWPDGSIHWVQQFGDIVRNRDGEPLNMQGVMQDIDVRKQAELALIERERQLQEAQRMANVGHWRADVSAGEFYWSDEIYRIVGRDPENFKITMRRFYDLVHPDDLDRLQKTEKVGRRVGHFDVIFRVIRPDGTVRHVHEFAKTKPGPENNNAILTGTLQDITERVRMEEKMAQQRALLDMLHHSTTDFVVNGDFRAAMNDMLKALLKLTGSEFGFAGEVIFKDDGRPFLKTHAITDISWDAQSRIRYEAGLENGFEFHKLDNLLGCVMTSRAPVLSNDPASDPRSGGFPEGHPAMNSFLGVPIFYGNDLVGMYGIANRENGYDTDIQDFLLPLDITYGAMIHSSRMAQKEEENRLALIEAREEALMANRAKSQFLSSMSHELRTPMNAIMGFGQLLTMEDDPPLNVSQRENVNEIVKASHHLLELINEVLDLAKVESGRIDLSIERTILSEILVESLQLIIPLAQKRGIDICLNYNGVDIAYDQLREGQCAVRADRTRLKQIFLNLLGNAIKYNSEKGKLTISCDSTKDAVTRVSISDTGRGLTPEEQTQLFKPFMRIGDQLSEIEGVGIGLVITKKLTELMGGTIGMNSQKGEGCTFWVEFPSDTPLASKATPVSDREDMPMGKNFSELGHEYTILYIEDNPANLRLVTQLLGRRPNIHMWSAHEPLLGLELAAAHNPDLILLDINLPNMNGYEVLKHLQNRKATRNTPVIAISANAMPGDIKKGMDAGFDDYITKPINVNDLLQAIEKALQGNV
ncbi:MAG: response regulator [Emcibacter sp.]|nr:response regulator [Emcibacter sp.]